MTVVDRRELVLERLETMLSGMTITLSNGVIPAGNFVRNRNELPGPDPNDPAGSPGLVPGIILCDGDEANEAPLAVPPGVQATRMRDQLVKMTPEIYVVLDVRKPQNVLVGQDLNIARQVILAAIMTDAALWNIVGANGNIKYVAAITDLSRNRDMKGQLGMSFSFSYPLLHREIRGS